MQLQFLCALPSIDPSTLNIVPTPDMLHPAVPNPLFMCVIMQRKFIMHLRTLTS